MGLTRQRSRVDGHWWYRSMLIAGVSTCSLALLLQFIGFVTPGWIILSVPSGSTISAGVWYLQVCSSVSRRCQTASMTRVENPFNVAVEKDNPLINWTELQSELTIAFVASIAAVAFIVHALVYLTHSPRVYLWWCISTSIISAGLAMIPISRLLNVIRTWNSHIEYNTPYSLVFSFLGVVCSIVTIFLSLCAIFMIYLDNRRNTNNSSERQDLTANTV